MSEIYYNHDDKCFNLKVVGVLQKNDKVLLCKYDINDYYHLPSGRVEFQETTEEAVIRIINKIINIDASVKKLISINEDFYTYQETDYHEISLVYLCEANETVNVRNDRCYEWIDLDLISELKIKPNKLISSLKQLPYLK